MKWVKLTWLVALVSLVVMGLNVPGNAAEIIYQDDIVTNVVTKDVLVRTADNVIVLIDASGSMDNTSSKYKKTYLRNGKAGSIRRHYAPAGSGL